MSEAVAPGGHPLASIFEPRSVAVIGASTDPKKRGYQVLRALRESKFQGRIFPVNPKGGDILGYAVAASVDALPEVPDLALICTPAATVPDAVDACGRFGIRGAVVLAVGFRESGPEGAELERRILEAARAHGIRVVGPNTSGILNLPLGLNLIGARGVRPGTLSLVVQSGNMALALMNEVTARSQEGIAICVGVGNQLDLGFHEYLDFLGHHEGTRAVICYAEGFPDARTFLQVAARVSRRKPVLVIKGARSASGEAAARSHTGAVAGEYDRLRAGFRQAHIVEVTRTDELLHLAETLANQPAVRAGAGLVILSDGGGQGTLAADALSDMGVPMARLSEATRGALRALLGSAAAVANPVDLAGASDADPEVFGRALEILAADDAVGGVLVVGLFGGYGIRFAEELAAAEERAARVMADTMRAATKPLVVHSMYASQRSSPLRILGEAHVPVVESLDVACRCIGETWIRGRVLGSPAWRPDENVESVAPGAGRRFKTFRPHESLARARAEGRDTLTEPEAQALLRDAGLTFPPSALCTTADEVARAVDGMQTAVALKVVSAKISHKTDAGGVALGIVSAAEAAEAFRAIMDRTARYLEARGAEPGVDGIMVAPMLSTPLAELLVGARRDPDVGPVLTLGAGGIWVEVLRDVSHRVLPVDADEVRRMLQELRTFGLLAGARGRASADLDAVVRAAEAVARCILEHDVVMEVEVNPLFVYSDGAQAVDARIFIGGKDGA
ncbi:MAG TPA: acetate--CoA ligase family protein [Longimicrobiales bacterium]|nr:acetate--CoA ligase family protein [Longimicrobiales bacterium]